MSGTEARRAELADNLERVRERISAACARAGRDPSEVTLIAVTKFFPASDVDLLVGLGITAIGENRDQEASAKVTELTRRQDVQLHFIGRLQTNKAASVVSYADVVQSVDRPKLVAALDRAAAARGVRPGVLVQVSLDHPSLDDPSLDGPSLAGPADRGGVDPRAAAALAEQVAACEHLQLRGVMAVAPLGADPAPAFARLRAVADGIREAHEGATWISAGMSGDLEAAIAHGATHLRVGSAILGSRQSHR